jgi:uncharacterized protein DUF3592
MKSKSYGCLIGISLFWWGITGIAAGVVVVAIARQLDARRRFLTADGTVRSSDVKTSRGGKGGTQYAPQVRYRYRVGEKEYDSERYTFDSSTSSGAGEYSRRIVAAHPPGRAIRVYYDPDRPEVAILDLDVPTGLWFWLLFLQPFLTIGVGMAWALATWFPQQRRLNRFLASPPSFPWTIPSWGVMQSSDGALRVEYRPSKAACIGGAWFLSTFLSMFAVGFLLGGFSNPPGWSVAAAFGGCAVVAIVGGSYWATRKRKTVRLDPGRMLEVVAVGEERTVSMKEITELLLYRPMVRMKGGLKPGSPRLAASLKGGGEIPLHDFTVTWDEDAVARKAGEVLAKAAGLPLRVAGAEPQRT